MIKILFQVFFLGLLLSGCSSQVNTSPAVNYVLDTGQRNETLAQIKQWKIDGKIAFLQQKNRESANMQWQVDQEKNSQSLNMTTYLGINVLTLKQTDDHSSIEVDGEVHHSEDLDLLIWNLTGFPLPTQALHAWIKGLPYSTNDRLTLDDNNLPRTIVSDYDGLTWQVYYQAYQRVDEHILPKRITIKQSDLTIKISINHWTL